MKLNHLHLYLFKILNNVEILFISDFYLNNSLSNLIFYLFRIFK